MLGEQLKFIYKGGHTKRFHTADTLTEQSVAAHSFGVAWLIVLIYPSARKDLILAGLAHDLAEHVIGDVSSPAKRRFPQLKSALDAAEHTMLRDVGLDFETGLTDFEVKVLKTADMLDGMMFCVRERRMGSKVVCDIYENFRNYYIGEGKRSQDLGYEVFLEIEHMWEKYNGR